MQTLRSLLFVIWLYGFMALFGILMLPLFLLPRPLTQRAIALYAQTIRAGLKLLCGIDVEIRGRENMPPGPLLYAGKHHCMFDIFVPFLITRDPMIILKKELLWYPALGWYAIKAKMIPIDRAGTTATLKKMVALAKQGASERREIIIFPEGTRVGVFDPPDYKAAGLSALNKALNVPVVMVATNAGLCWPARGLSRRPGRIIYQVLGPLPAGLERKTLMDRLETELEAASNALVEEGLRVQGRARPAEAAAEQGPETFGP